MPSSIEFPFLPSLWVLVPSLVGLVLLWWWVYRWARDVATPGARRWLSALRIAATLIVLFCICHPIYREYQKGERKSTVAVLFDASRSMSIPDMPGDQPRLRWAVALVNDPKTGLDVKLRQHFSTKYFAFGDDLREIDVPLAAKPTEQRTCIARALSRLASVLADENVAAVVLLSDGADNSHENLAPVLAAHRQQGAPVYAVPVGATSGAKDIEVSSVTTKRRVSLGTEVTLSVVIRSPGAKGLKVPLRLTQGKKVVAESVVTLAGEPQVEALVFTPQQEGLLRYRVEIPVQPGEIIRQNNAEELVIKSSKYKLRVLYMEGTQYKRPDHEKWEFQFLVDALERDKDVQVTTLFRDDVQAARKVGIACVRDPERGFPRTKKKLYEYDVIISSDIDIEYFTEKQLKLTVDFVRDHGGGFAMVGGYTAFGTGGYDESVIDELLPVDMQGRSDGYREYQPPPVVWQLTEEGLRHPIMQIDPDPDKNAEIWKNMPGFFGFNYVLRAKPAATVLAVHPSKSTKFGRRVLLAVQPFGRGRSMAFMPDTTAGWGEIFETDFGEAPDNQYFRQFWQNAVRWLGAYQMQAPNKRVLVSTRVNRYALGEEAEILAEVRDEDFELTFESTVRAEVKTPAGKIDTVRMEPDLKQKGAYFARYKLRDQGRYEVLAKNHAGGKLLDQDVTMFFCDQSQAEFRGYALNRDLLQRVADATGGRVLDPQKLDLFVKELRQATHQAEAYAAKCFWDSPYVYALILLLLAAEWFWRRRVGLP